MRSQDPKNIPAGRYTDAHLETLQKLYLYAWFCEYAELGVVTTKTVTVKDTEIELKPRIRRNCIVDLIRDQYLIPPDAIQTRGDKLYGIDELVLEFLKVTGGQPEGVICLGRCFDRRIIKNVPLSRMAAFHREMCAGRADILWEELDGVRFCSVVLIEKEEEVEEEEEEADRHMPSWPEKLPEHDR